MKNEQGVYAVVFPLSREHIRRIFGGKDVFCKYTGERDLRIRQGSKILFYASASGGEILGEAQVKSVEFLAPGDIISKYGDRLFLSSHELEIYRYDRSSSQRLFVAILTNVSPYEKPKISQHSPTMAGRTLSKNEYFELVNSTSH